jgi:hypothetical protein
LTPFQTHCYLENLVAPAIEPGTSLSEVRNSDHETIETVLLKNNEHKPFPTGFQQNFTLVCVRDVDNNKMDLLEIGLNVVDWFGSG